MTTNDTLRRVYFNLHKKCLSVQAKVNGRWKVIDHVNEIHLNDIQFKVYEKGRQRVINSKRKNVHAFIIGHESKTFAIHKESFPVSYNPYKTPKFYNVNTGEHIEYADSIGIIGRKITVYNL